MKEHSGNTEKYLEAARILTRYLDMDESLDGGKWIIDNENDGSHEHPRHLPYVLYSRLQCEFMSDVSRCVEIAGLHNYMNVLGIHGIMSGGSPIEETDTAALPIDAVLALIVLVYRGDRFGEGYMLRFFRNGAIKKWLLRLKELEIKSAEM